MLLKINYGVNRKVTKNKKKYFEHKNGKLEVEGEWGEKETQKRIKEEIKKANPSWNITGYCLPESNRR